MLEISHFVNIAKRTHDQCSIYSTVQKFCPNYGLLLESHSLTPVLMLFCFNWKKSYLAFKPACLCTSVHTWVGVFLPHPFEWSLLQCWILHPGQHWNESTNHITCLIPILWNGVSEWKTNDKYYSCSMSSQIFDQLYHSVLYLNRK